MNPDQLFARYRELQNYVGWTADDAVRVTRLAEPLRCSFPAMVDDFYAEIQRHPSAMTVIDGGQEQIDRLKVSLTNWLHDLLRGPYDRQYVERRWRVGIRHAEIGLRQGFTNAALARLRTRLITAALRLDILDNDAKIQTIHSLNRLLDLDLAVIEDSYEYHRMQLAQAAERQRGEVKFRNLVEAAACMILILREDLKIAYFSPFAEKLTGYPSDSVTGKHYPSLFVASEFQDEVRCRLLEALQGSAVHDYEASVVCSDASIRWLTWNVIRIDDFDGQHAVLAVGHDITDSRRAAHQLLQSERLAAIGQTITGLAHEGRNALQRINSCTEMLEFEVEENQNAMQLIHRLQMAQDDLRRLFDEVRNFAAPIQLERSRCRIPGIWHEAWELLRTEWTGRQVTMDESIAADLPDIDGDRFRLVQVFRNLIENSLAACRDPVRIHIDCHRSRDKPQWIEIRFRDNGTGLGQVARERVFQPFFTTKTKGTGLGMAIAQRIIEAHGGTIRVGEAETNGAEFVLTLPIGHS